MKEGNAALWARVMSDYQCQIMAMEVMKSIQGSDYKDPRLVSQHGVFHGKQDGRFQTNKAGIPTGVYTMPYLLHAYDVSESSFKRKRIEIKEGKICRPPAVKAPHHRGRSVINNSLLSSVRQKLLTGEPPEASYTGSWDHHMARQKYWGALYDEATCESRFGKRKRRISSFGPRTLGTATINWGGPIRSTSR